MSTLLEFIAGSRVQVRRELLPELETLIGCWIVEQEWAKRRIDRMQVEELEAFRESMRLYHRHAIAFCKHMLAIVGKSFPLDRVLLVDQLMKDKAGRIPKGKSQLKLAVNRLRNHVPSLPHPDERLSSGAGIGGLPDTTTLALPERTGGGGLGSEGDRTDGGTDPGGPSTRSPDDSRDDSRAGHRKTARKRPGRD